MQNSSTNASKIFRLRRLVYISKTNFFLKVLNSLKQAKQLESRIQWVKSLESRVQGATRGRAPCYKNMFFFTFSVVPDI